MDNIRLQLQEAVLSCQERGLTKASQWAAEMLMGMTLKEPLSKEDTVKREQAAKAYKKKDSTSLSDVYQERVNDPDQLRLARIYFDCKEYRRCAHLLKECTDQKSLFLRLYSQYLMGEKEVQDICMDVFGSDNSEERVNTELPDIIKELEPLFNRDELDGFNCYLFGFVLRQQQRNDEALEALVRSLTRYPINWSAWLELGECFDTFDKANVTLARLSDHFTRTAFQCYLAIEKFAYFEVMEKTVPKIEQIFPTSRFIKGLYVSEAYRLQDFTLAETHFDDIRRQDPYQLEQMDTFSHVLFVNRNAVKLSVLARECEEVDKYRPETCLVLGNYYGLRQDHEKAISYYRRALKLNRHYLAAWTLMGHEYLELGNMHAAIEAYRRAVDINNYDYRALFALGHAYEMLRLFHYSIAYFQRATAVRPFDARMWKGQATCYESMGEDNAAIKCYQRAMLYETDKGETLSKLAALHKKQNKQDEVIMYYKLMVEDEDDVAQLSVDLAAQAYYTLAVYEKERKRYQQAIIYVTKLINLDSMLHDEAHALSRELQQLKLTSRNR